MRILDIALKLLLWFLITTDTSLANCLIGGAVALLLPQFGKTASARASLSHIKLWLQMLWKIVLAIPQAYVEAFEMMLKPHKIEEITVEKVEPHRTRGLIFLDIFLITFTPKTIVVDYFSDDDARGSYVVHSIRRR
ncbi:MAG: Na+/H+ antiporter subunit E [Cyanobacteria bacterium P01_D01_bin.105]